MSAEAPAITRTWQVGRYSCTLTIQRPQPGRVSSAVVEWSPEQPRRLTAAERKQYLAGRDAAVAELGLPAMVVDL